jgi:hypothetical protein
LIISFFFFSLVVKLLFFRFHLPIMTRSGYCLLKLKRIYSLFITPTFSAQAISIVISVYAKRSLHKFHVFFNVFCKQIFAIPQLFFGLQSFIKIRF